MSGEAPEARFHSKFFDKLDDYIHSEDTPFEAVYIEDRMESGGRADIFVESYLTESLVIEVKRDDKNPSKREFITQAKNYADDKGAKFFAVCNSNDLFLFDYAGETNPSEIDFHYLDLRNGDIYDRTFGGLIPKILQAVQYLAQHNQLPHQKDREQIVGLLRSFHASIWPTYKTLARESYGKNAAFTNTFEEWVAENDYASRDEDEQFEIAAKQHAYLLANKILFYDVVREKTPDEVETASGHKLDSLYQTSSGSNIGVSGIKPRVDQQFQKIVEEIDYEPVFDDSGTVFAVFPENKKTQKSIQTLLENFEPKNITDVDEDLLGELYEELIPKEERRRLGQFYTPPSIAKTIVRWVIEDESDELPRILDPASGSGTFPVEAYEHLKTTHSSADHQSIVDSLIAVDINKFPIHLTAFNLAIRRITESTERILTKNDSFFDVSPTEETLNAFTEDGEIFTTEFDAVVGNPPYIFHQNLFPNKEHFRHHLNSYTDENDNTPFYDGEHKFSTYTDAYVYFTTHGLRFLRDGGRLGFVTPSKWMDVEYGLPFQEFLYDNVKIHAIVGFEARAFEDALVDTTLLLIEKCDDGTERSDNTVDFIQVKETIPPQDLVDTIEFSRTVPDGEQYRFESRSGYRVVSRRQGDLADEGPRKFGYYLTAPKPVIELIDSGVFTPLDEFSFSKIRRGYMTGANSFFILDEEDIDQWNIDQRFLTPAIKSVKDLHALETPPEGVGLHMLDLREYIDDVRSMWKTDGRDIALVDAVKEQLGNDGYGDVRRYIEYGESQGVDEMYNPSQRTVWFQLPELVAPDVLHPRFYDDDLYTIRNRGQLAPSDAIMCIWFNKYSDVMSGIMNSTLYKTILEVWGRKEGGGALQFLPDDGKTIPVPDPRILDDVAKQRIIDATEKLEYENDVGQNELDAAVLEGFGIDLEVDDLQRMQALMTDRRVGRARNTTVLIKELDEYDEYDLEGFVEKDEHKRGTPRES